MKIFRSHLILVVLNLVVVTYVFGQWQPKSNGIQSSIAYCFIEAVDGSILAGTSNGIYRTLDAGDNWSTSSTGLANNDGTILRFTKNGNRVFAGTGQSVYYSDDNGITWILSESFGVSVFGLKSVSGQIFAGTMGEGIYKSIDNGVSWANSNAGLLTDSVYSLAVSGSNLLAGTYGKGIFVSSDQAQNWSQAYSQFDPTVVRTIAANSTRMFAGLSIQSSPIAAFNSLLRSNNNGQTWSMPNATGLPSPGNVHITAIHSWDTNVLLNSGGQIYLSTDNGSVWNTFMNGFTSSPPYGIACFDETTDYIFCGVEAGGAGSVFRIAKNQFPTSISSVLGEKYFNIYPNPSDGNQITLDYKFSQGGSNQWIIVDSKGRLVYECNLTAEVSRNSVPNALVSGVYQSIITSNGILVATEKLVVSK